MHALRHRLRQQAPWIAAALCCAVAIALRTFLIQPAEIAQRCDAKILSLATTGPWWCSVRSAAIMTYAWGGLRDAALVGSVAALLWHRRWLGLATLAIGLVAIVWYTYESGALAITVGALVLARRQQDPQTGRSRR